ncbi:MAG: hypothetical protein Q4A98_03235 [Comamonadaceae bacterium]|nr:hypothetical protein [Comamonadaceae bacterium]
MSQHLIKLFMWGYQQHYRFSVEYLLKLTLQALGAEDAGEKCLLVGVKIPGAKVAHDVCVEPEDDQWPVALFANLLPAIDEQIKNHPLNNIFYGDEPRMRDKPENIRRDSVRKAVQDALVPYDAQASVRSFAGSPAPVDGYYVVPVLQIPNALFERFRPLREPVTDGRYIGVPSLIHAAINEVLSEAYDELLRPDPGRYISTRLASAEEIVNRAASKFMYTPGIAIGGKSYVGHNLFERFNLASSLMYEGVEGKGRMLLTTLDNDAVNVALALEDPVPFGEPRWARKILQMASAETALLASTESILGLGSIAEGADPWITQNIFEVKFHDHYHWSLSCGKEVLLVSRYGVPSLPRDKFPRARLLDTFQRLFPEVNAVDVDSFTALFDTAIEQRRGSMLVVAQDAAAEAVRLCSQGTKIVPTKLTPDLYRRVSNIDGTIIIDPQCNCHAVGVILDGSANDRCTPSRGARYNSGIRYVAASATPRLAIVVSDDRTVDVIPILHPRIRRSVIEAQIAKLEASSIENHHGPIDWLDTHRFYLDQTQCDRINAVQKKLNSAPRDVGEIRILRAEFHPDPLCTAEYIEPEAST